MGQAASAAVPDELHEDREGFGGSRRYDEPALDGVAAEARERHVVHVDGGQTQVGAEFEAGVQVVGPGLVEGGGPERVEVLGLHRPAAVGVQFIEGEIEQGHVGPPHVARVNEWSHRTTVSPNVNTCSLCGKTRCPGVRPL